MKGSFSTDPALYGKLFELLEIVFPGITAGAAEIRTLGFPWESVSTPFVLCEDDRVIAHAGLIELPLIVSGERVRVGSVHAVATHPDHRRQGRFRRVMDALIQDCGDRYPALILTTENPEYYEPFGFRRVQEHCFIVPGRHPGGDGGLRRLDARDADDAALLRRLLETREPVSRVVGVIDETAVFCFNEVHRRPHYAEDLDALFCMEVKGTRLRLFDVVAPTVPPLSELIRRVEEPVEEVVIHFAPDRLQVDAEAVPYLFEHDGPSHLMARGSFAAEGEAFTLPRSART